MLSDGLDKVTSSGECGNPSLPKIRKRTVHCSRANIKACGQLVGRATKTTADHSGAKKTIEDVLPLANPFCTTSMRNDLLSIAEEIRDDESSSSDENEQAMDAPSSAISAPFREYFASCVACRTDYHQPALTAKFINQTRGRGVMACKDFKMGELLWKESALVALPFEDKADQICGYCFKNIPSHRQPQKYCGKTCEDNDWPLHKYEKSFTEKRSYPNVVKFLARIKRMKDMQDPRAGFLSELVPGELDVEWAEKMVNVTFQARDLLGEAMPPARALHFMSLLQTNGMAIHHLEDFARRADGLFVATALANHSCTPNAVALFHERVVYVYALCDISENDEVCINYIDVCESEWMRREQLQRQFGFSCRCSLCVQERAQYSATHEAEQRRLYYAAKHIQKLQEYEQFEATSNLDPRLLQELRKRMTLKLIEKSTCSYPCVVKISQRIVDTYAQYLGPEHPITLFFELSLVLATVHTLNETPRSPQECRQGAIKGRALMQQIEAWQKSMLRWCRTGANLNIYDVKKCLLSVKHYSTVMEMYSG